MGKIIIRNSDALLRNMYKYAGEIFTKSLIKEELYFKLFPTQKGNKKWSHIFEELNLHLPREKKKKDLVLSHTEDFAEVIWKFLDEVFLPFLILWKETGDKSSKNEGLITISIEKYFKKILSTSIVEIAEVWRVKKIDSLNIIVLKFSWELFLTLIDIQKKEGEYIRKSIKTLKQLEPKIVAIMKNRKINSSLKPLLFLSPLLPLTSLKQTLKPY